MKDENKTREQLINELVKMRQRVVELGASETECKLAEQASQEAREYVDSIVATVRQPLVVLDGDLKVISANRSFYQTFQVTPEETQRQQFIYQLCNGQWDIPRLRELLEEILPQNTSFDDFEMEHDFPTVGRKVMLFNAHKIYRETNKVEMILLAIEDITERKQIERAVQDARESRERVSQQEQLILTDRLASIGELASGIAHELNNPLTSVIGFSELLSEKKDIPADVKEDLEVINREAKRTAEVVKNLITFARKHPPAKQLVNINNIIQTVLTLRAYEQRINNIQVDTRFAPDLPEVMADGFQLQQVFLNIINNAEFFMIEAHGRGTFTITTERVGDIIRASLADDGPGIPKENLEHHLFNPFFTTKEVGKGTGLGLSISHGIITAHGGRIYAESELGKGATFIMELPINQQDREGAVR